MAAHPDAALIAAAEAFLAAELEDEAACERLEQLPAPWSAEDERDYERLTTPGRGYQERLAAISSAKPVTREGLIAQAKVVLWHSRPFSGDDQHAWNLAESVLRVLDEPLPLWAVTPDRTSTLCRR